MKTITDDMSNTCFFCSKKIDGKKSKEHIISNSLLDMLGIKEETITGKEGEFQYSWLIRFVLCHRFRSHCASDFGSNRAIILGSFCAN